MYANHFCCCSGTLGSTFNRIIIVCEIKHSHMLFYHRYYKMMERKAVIICLFVCVSLLVGCSGIYWCQNLVFPSLFCNGCNNSENAPLSSVLKSALISFFEACYWSCCELFISAFLNTISAILISSLCWHMQIHAAFKPITFRSASILVCNAHFSQSNQHLMYKKINKNKEEKLKRTMECF